MKRILTFIIVVFFASNIKSNDGFVKKFELFDNPLKLCRLAQPTQYFDKIGQKAALMGFEDGTFEMWIWPWKVLRNFNISFYLNNSTQPILSKDIVKSILVTPETTELIYTYESFTVKQIIYVPYDKPGAVILLDVSTTESLSIVTSFLPVMQPQWPAGIGGQYSYWNDELKAFHISASQQSAAFFCGSPVAEKMTAPPAHMFSDNPLQFKINVHPGKSGQYIPIIISGNNDAPASENIQLYNDLWKNAEKYYQSNYKYYLDLHNNTTQIITPDEKLNLAFEWGKVALHNLLVDNSNLGKGLVAGYGLSGGGGRPGFAWYFGGDSFINIMAFNSFGDFSTVRDALNFNIKWQRKENFPIRKLNPDDKNIEIGKMAHELSQSEGIIDWWNNYRYGYNHADTTPWYLVAVGDYVRSSGDTGFVKQNWQSITQAYKWCISKDINDDGLMDLEGAGLGVLEFGELVKIPNDLYTQALWTQSLKEIIDMAKMVGDKSIEKEAEKIYEIAHPNLDKIFWIEKMGFYSFGANADGQKVEEKSPYTSPAMFFDLMDVSRSEKTIKELNKADMITDWGIRNLSIKSKLYDPANYNYGTVWPFTSALFGAAQYKHHFSAQGFYTINTTYPHIFEFGLGISPEVMSGKYNQKLGEAYHNQGFSYTGYIYPLMTGLAGVTVNALQNKIIFAPQIPVQWDSFKIQNIKLGDQKVTFIYKKINDEIEISILPSTEEQFTSIISPSFSLGTKINSVMIDGKEINYEHTHHSQAEQISLETQIKTKAKVVIKIETVPEIFLLDNNCGPGEENSGLKIISQELKGNTLIVDLEGMSGKVYKVGMKNMNKLKSLKGAEIKNDYITIEFDSIKKYQYINQQIEIVF